MCFSKVIPHMHRLVASLKVRPICMKCVSYISFEGEPRTGTTNG